MTLPEPNLTELLIKASCLLAVAPLIAFGMRKASAATRHLLLGVTMLGLLLLPFLSLGLPVWKLEVLPPQSSAVLTPSAPAPPQPSARERVRSAPGIAAWAPSTFAPIDYTQVAATASTLGPARSGVKVGLTAIWLLGTLLLIAKLIAGLLRMQWIVRRGDGLADPRLLEILATTRDRLGLRKSPRPIVTDRVSVPVVWGWRRPTLVLPREALQWSADRLRVVMLHELAHLERLDWPVLLLGRVVTSLYWLHPLAWYLERAARQECEKACDDRVVDAGTKPSEYAAQLVAIARGMGEPRVRVRTALAFVRRSQLTGRVRSILDPRLRRDTPSRAAACGSAALMLLAIGVFASAQLAHKTHAAEPRDEAARAESPTDSDSRHAGETGPLIARKLTDEKLADTGSDQDDLTGEARPLIARKLTDEKLAGTGSDQDDFTGEAQPLVAQSMKTKNKKKRADRDSIDRDANDPEELFAHAYDLHRSGRYEEAITAFEQVAAAGHRASTALYNAACGHALLGDAPAAIASLEQAREAGWDEPEMLVRDSDFDPIRSNVRFQEFIDDAFAAEGLKRKSKHRPYRVTMDTLAHLEDSGSTDAAAWHEVGTKLLQMRQLDSAIEALTAAVEHAGEEGSTSMYNLACAYSLAGKTRSALEWLDRSVDAGFSHHERFVNDTDLDPLRGTEAFDRIAEKSEFLSMERFPRRTWDHSEYSASRWEPAIAQFGEYVRTHPQSGRGWFSLGYALHHSERFDESIDAFAKAHELGFRPSTSAFNVACGNALLQHNDAALDWLETAVATGRIHYGMLQDDDLDSLRDEPRFERLLESLEDHDASHGVMDHIKRVWREMTDSD